MKRLLTFVCLVILSSLLILPVNADDIWTIYNCNKLPDAEVRDFTARDDSDSEIIKIIDDDAIAGNKLLEFNSPGSGKYRWTNEWTADASKGITMVFRAKGLDSSKYMRAFEIQYGNGQARDKFIGLSDNTVLLEMANVTTEQNTAQWHIYRLVIEQKDDGIATTVYIDEKPTPLIDKAVSASKTEKKFLEFGDSSGNNDYGSLFDWIIWTTKGAFSPEQAPLPDGLTKSSKLFFR